MQKQLVGLAPKLKFKNNAALAIFMLALGLASRAASDESTEAVDISSLKGIESYTVNNDGSITIKMVSGDQQTLAAADFSIASDGSVMVSQAAVEALGLTAAISVSPAI